ncbi:MAG TPA: ATP-binding protein [Phycisphaerae bacterium]|nr:ATP-binding protein [Phycisphaerae bacterium]
MVEGAFKDMKNYIAFGTRDAANLRALAVQVRPHLPAVVARFHREIQRHPRTRAVLSEGPEQVQRLLVAVTEWLESLFCGQYDAEYCRQHAQIGRVHARAGLPQHFMFTAMEVVWQELSQAVRQADPPDAEAGLRALHKLLTLETGIMLESYWESRAAEIRQFERNAVRERLTQAEQLAQIGHLAASLAHEIKNPLAGISGAIQVIRDGMDLEDQWRPILEEVLRQTNRLDGTVKDLLVYARPRPPRFQRCKLNRLIERVLTVLRREPDLQRVRVDYINSRQLPLYGDEAQIEQLVMNLLHNAAHASPDGGLVRVLTTSNADGLRLVVEDQGQGMDQETCQRAFEPFFTTKARGTGLGLPICRKIVDAHGGTISIRSAVGQGTTVTVRLPRYPPATSGGSDDDHSRTDR